MATRRILLALLCLLSLTTSAYAECAWVLWAQRGSAHRDDRPFVTRYDPSGWAPTRGFTSQKACEEEQATLDRKEGERQRERRKLEPKQESWGEWLYVCLPDTVDPRGPKGK